MLAPLILLMLLPGAEPNEAEKLFRQMETKVMKAKTIECVFEAKFEGVMAGSLKGTLLSAEGNKFRLEMSGASGGREGQATTIADGTKIVVVQDKVAKEMDAPKWLGEAMRASITRPGVPLPVLEPSSLGEQDKEFKVEEAYRLGDFKLGKKEMVGKQEAQIVHHTLTIKGKDVPPCAVTVWIDTKTQLPLKRVLTLMKGDKAATFTTTYSKLDVDAKIDPKQFELPK